MALLSEAGTVVMTTTPLMLAVASEVVSEVALTFLPVAEVTDRLSKAIEVVDSRALLEASTAAASEAAPDSTGATERNYPEEEALMRKIEVGSRDLTEAVAASEVVISLIEAEACTLEEVVAAVVSKVKMTEVLEEAALVLAPSQVLFNRLLEEEANLPTILEET